MTAARRARLLFQAFRDAVAQIMADIRGMPRGYYVVMVGLVMVGNLATILVSR